MTFDDLKAAWPKGKRGSGLKQAAEKFAKIPAEELPRVAEGLERWKASRQWQNGAVHHIKTWLNQRAWIDALEEAPESADTLSEKDWRLWDFWVRRVGRHRAEVCEHDPECQDGQMHMERVLQVLRASRS